MLVNGMSMNAVADPEPHARPRVLNPAYLEPTTDYAACKERLRRQLAQVQREEEDRTSTTVSRAAG